jgi:TolB-like protein/DNA-binding winged helix-turn-helix (wHTH) protein/Flp pilus assembly protein TadD
MQAHPGHVFEFGAFRLVESERRLLKDGQPVQLPPKVFDTLLVLVESRGRLVEKQELMSRLWPDSFVEEVNLNRSISSLRKALGENATNPIYIETVPKSGYRFLARVTEVETDDAVFVLEKHTSAEIITEEEEEMSESARPQLEFYRAQQTRGKFSARNSRSWQIATASVIGLLACLVAYLSFHRTSASESSTPIKSVAVMPFKNLMGDSTQEYFSDGLTESFIAQLSKVDGLKVLSRTSAFSFKGKDIDVRSIGVDLGVEAVLEGSVRKSGDRLRVDARLVSTKDGHVIWASESYDRVLKDIFVVQDEIACSVTAGLRVKLCEKTTPSLERQGAKNVDAYEAYLKGLYHLNKRTKDGVSKAAEYFQQAIQLDPNDAPAYAGLADCYFQNIYLTSTPPSELIAEGKAMASKALSIDQSLGEAHALLSILNDAEWNWKGAVSEGELAVSLSPGSARAHHLLAFVLAKRARFDEGLAEIRKARELDPLNLVINSDIAEILCFAGRYDEAIEQCRKTLELDPNFSLAQAALGFAYWGKGMYQEAVAPLQRAVELEGEGSARMIQLEIAYGLAGQKKKAQAFLTSLKERAKTGEPVDPLWLARLCVAIGAKDEALGWIEKACDEHTPNANGLLVEADFVTLRSEPRYQAVLRRIGF